MVWEEQIPLQGDQGGYFYAASAPPMEDEKNPYLTFDAPPVYTITAAGPAPVTVKTDSPSPSALRLARCCGGYLMVFSSLLLLGGLALVGGGIYALVSLSKTDNLTGVGAIIAGTVLGGLVAFIALIACCSAWKKSRPLLIAAFALLVVVVLAQAGVTIALSIESGSIDERLAENWNSSSSRTQYQIEKAFSCCGWTGAVAGSACGSSKPDSPPCKNTIVDAVQRGMLVVILVASAVFAVQLLAIVAVAILLAYNKHLHSNNAVVYETFNH